ncbi:hypothetical protein [Hespellia stercorisuis]|uniref:hypothetical protein n=1 Tax=Hespellia stercorisuis TaxID=180311 RepID=UPI000934DD88|nr:hypothetical protein [Hespellia stercorisuis]
MQKRIKQYLKNTIEESKTKLYMPSEKTELKSGVILLRHLGLITLKEYQEWECEFESILAQSVAELSYDNGILECLSRIQIRTCGQLREILISDQQTANFFRIRNIGEKKRIRIVLGALECGIVDMNELGAEYTQEQDRMKWEDLKRTVVTAKVEHGKTINSKE